jgi:putative transcriptional regulator
MAQGTVRIIVSDLLKERGLSVRDLVEKTGMSYNTALALVRNSSTRLDLDTVARICGAFNVEVSEVLEYVPEKGE